MKCHGLLSYQQRWKHKFQTDMEEGRLHSAWVERCPEIDIMSEWLERAQHTPYAESEHFERLYQSFQDMVESAYAICQFGSQAKLVNLTEFNRYNMQIVSSLAKLRHHESDEVPKILQFSEAHGRFLYKADDLNQVTVNEDGTKNFTSEQPLGNVQHNATPDQGQQPSLQGFLQYLRHKPENVGEDG